ncbi:hypothetical protein BDA99DRAFT_557639 [Phascolomyces articulosus]|uniref:F-box domain-containing protein n=1 Tax=Phascolomyces articulosus TaxID=60185 RepID=A0AAD5K482_9FUNG|nr:hypothetical protein BDA99DRAFT_557639 [Phascolomyces articulosus]
MLQAPNDRRSLLTELPHEILDDIILRIPLLYRIRCTQVSKAWHSLFLSSSTMWNDISECDDSLADALAPYKINGQDIHIVEVGRTSERKDIEFLIKLGCSKIHSLVSVYSGLHFERLLYQTGSAIRDLNIMATFQSSTDDIFYTLFTTCPNLTRLQYRNTATLYYRYRKETSIYKIRLNSHITTSMKHLRELRITLPTNLSETALKQLLPLFTGLEHLYLTKPFQCDGLLDWMEDQILFPSLRTIWLGPPLVVGNRFPTDYMNTQSNQRIGLAFDDEYIDVTSVERFLKKNIPKVADLNAFYSKMDFSSEQAFQTIERMVGNDLVLRAPFLKSMVIEDSCTRYRRRRQDVGAPRFDMDLVLDNFPCLEQLVLLYMGLKCSKSVSMTTNPETTAKVDDHTLEDDNQKKSKSNIKKDCLPSLKIVKFAGCYALTGYDLERIIHYRFQSHMDYVCFIGFDNEVLSHALESLSKKVQVLDQLVFGHRQLKNNTIQKMADAWKDHPLGTLKICIERGQTEAKEAIAYADQMLNHTSVSYTLFVGNL